MSRVLADPLEALQRAQYSALTTDAALQALAEGGVAILDHVNSPVFPRVVIGEDRQTPDDSEYHTGSEIYSTVRVYSQATGKIEAKRIAGRTRFVLEKINGFTIEGFRVLAGHCVSSELHPHQDGATTQIELVFRYLVQPG